ncbi:MFS transporter [Kitasatospora cineracea]|uniref:Putative MFS family arabinose efflux permease n=1 Tax=Kitasatospora cineracea TaxID=88074 RepID=A0A8G1UB03_9ACTN|nr:MFS transporter [Kitasatospora cineracea]ROR37460.1 putative MFS family arabinose efflux permease [Kitasatospora cineracea]
MPVLTTRLLLDTAPLRDSPAFRRLWLGQGLSQIGGQMTVFAVALQVYRLTGSSAAVGALGLAVAVPVVLFAAVGGSLGDRTDRRRLVLWTSSLQAGVSVLFAAQALAGLHSPGLLYLLVALQSLVGSVNAPGRRACTPRLLPRRQLAAAAALNALTMQFGAVAGPACAGLAAATWGLTACYLLDALSFAAALYGIARLPAMPPQGDRPPGRLAGAGEALALVRSRGELAGAFLADLCIALVASPAALLPALCAERFGGHPQTLGLLAAAGAVGGVLASACSGPAGRIARPGGAALLCCAAYGATVAALAVTRSLETALLLLALAGAADTLAVVFHSTVVQLSTPDRLRGRISAVEFVVGVGGTQLGRLRAGTLGALLGTGTAMLGGGLAAVAAAALVSVAAPAFTHYRAADAPAEA